MSGATDPSGVLHKRRDAEPCSDEQGDPKTTESESTPMDMSSLSDADKAKLRKELASGLVVGQWIIPPVLWAVAASDGSYYYNFESVYFVALLCNVLLIMAVGYLVQGRIEHWHIRPSIVWATLPLLFQLLQHETFMFAILLLVVSIPFVVVFATWCARYGFGNTCRLGLQYIQRCFTFEGMFSRRLVTLTKRSIYDLDALCDLNEDSQLEAAETGANDIEEKHSSEDLARIRANTERHLKPYIRGMIFLLFWGGWWIYYSSCMVAPYGPNEVTEFTMSRPLDDFRYRGQAYLSEVYPLPQAFEQAYRPVKSYPRTYRYSKSSGQEMLSSGKEIVTITIHKEEGVKLGLNAEPVNGKLVVTHVNKNGLLAGTKLRPGMELFGVNGIEVARMSLGEAKQVVMDAKGTIEIIALKDRVAGKNNKNPLSFDDVSEDNDNIQRAAGRNSNINTKTKERLEAISAQDVNSKPMPRKPGMQQYQNSVTMQQPPRLEQYGMTMRQQPGLEQYGMTMQQPPRLEQYGMTMRQPPRLEQYGMTMRQQPGLEQYGMTMQQPPPLQQYGMTTQDHLHGIRHTDNIERDFQHDNNNGNDKDSTNNLNHNNIGNNQSNDGGEPRGGTTNNNNDNSSNNQSNDEGELHEGGETLGDYQITPNKKAGDNLGVAIAAKDENPNEGTVSIKSPKENHAEFIDKTSRLLD